MPQQRSLADRFWEKVVIDPDGCWLWTGSTRGSGYGQHRSVYAHREAYEQTHGPIPEGFHIHHVCGRKLCVNPEHLVAVSRKQHGTLHSKETCGKGHRVVGTNVYVDPKTGSKRCVECKRAYLRSWSGWQGGTPNSQKTHCIHGHPLSGENLRIDKDGKRRCKECGRTNWRKWSATTPEGRAHSRRRR